MKSLQLSASYHHDRKQVDIETTLHERGLNSAQVCPVLAVGARPDLSIIRFSAKVVHLYSEDDREACQPTDEKHQLGAFA